MDNENNFSDTKDYKEWTEQPMPYTLGDHVVISLLSILKDMNAPLWSFKRIMNWDKNASNLGYKFDSKHTTYQTALAYYEKQYNFEYIRPIKQKINLEGYSDSLYICNLSILTNCKVY